MRYRPSFAAFASAASVKYQLSSFGFVTRPVLLVLQISMEMQLWFVAMPWSLPPLFPYALPPTAQQEYFSGSGLYCTISSSSTMKSAVPPAFGLANQDAVALADPFLLVTPAV